MAVVLVVADVAVAVTSSGESAKGAKITLYWAF